MSVQAKKMTEGNPFRLIFLFAVPLMLGNVFQQLYVVVDTLIVGRALGVDALAALGSADWFAWLIPAMAIGFTQGCAILLSQDFGSGDVAHLRRSFAHSILLSAAVGIILTLVSELSLSGVLQLLRTPDKIRPMTRNYLSIYFAGLPIQVAFNLLAATLRSLGNSKTPLVAMSAASVTNILADLLFVYVFKWGITGAAVATLLSQALSAVICFMAVRSVRELSLAREDFALQRALTVSLIRLAWPMVLQNAVIAIGGMVVGYVVNGLGVVFVAGYTSCNKLYGALELAAVAYGYAIVSYTGQNYGAGAYGRIREGLRSSLILGVLTGAVIGALMILFRDPIIGAFLSGDVEDVAAAHAIGTRYLTIMGSCLPILYILYVTRSMLQGLGDTVMPMLSGAAEFVMRCFMALVMTRFLGGESVMYGEVIAWLGADMVLIPALIHHLRRMR